MRRHYVSSLLAFVSCSGAAAYAQHEITRFVIGPGGGAAESSSYSVQATLGQPIVGSASSPTYGIVAGFWAGINAGGGGGTCIYAASKSSKGKGGCQTCPQKRDRFSSGVECLGPNECTAKVKNLTIVCPGGGPGTCTKVKGKRVDCGAP